MTASPSPASALTVNLTVGQSGNFASSGSTGSSKTVSVPTSGSATYPVSTVNDNTDEDNGSVTVTVNTGTGYTVGSSNSSATVTVNDNDTAGVTVSQSARTVAENGGTATYTVGLDTRPAGQVIITVTAGGAAFVDGPGGTAKPKAKDTLTFTTSTLEHGADGDDHGPERQHRECGRRAHPYDHAHDRGGPRGRSEVSSGGVDDVLYSQRDGDGDGR